MSHNIENDNEEKNRILHILQSIEGPYAIIYWQVNIVFAFCLSSILPYLNYKIIIFGRRAQNVDYGLDEIV